jgi:integrase
MINRVAVARAASLTMLSGLRRGELFALRWKDLDTNSK